MAAVRAPLAARIFAVVGLTAAVVGAIGAITLRIVDHAPVLPSTFGFGDIALVGFAVMGVAYASVGALLVGRRPWNAIGWCMVLIGVGYALGGFAAAATYAFAAIGTEDAQRTAQLTGWLTVLFTPLGGIVFAIGFIFPTGQGQTKTWDRLVRLFLITWPPFLLMILIQPGHLHVFPTIQNPFGIGPDLRFGQETLFSPPIAAGLAVLVPTLLWSLISRYRLADTTERQQLKWFALSIALSIGAVSVAGLGAVVSDDPPEIGLAVFGFAGAFVPVAIGIAILQHRLYDIDRLISRTLGYAIVTTILVGVFTAAALGLTAILGSIAQSENVAIAAATLLVAASFASVRARAQGIVDRRFDRARYDADRVIHDLGSHLREDVEIDRLTSEVIDAVDRTLHPSSRGIWLRPQVAANDAVTNRGRSVPTLRTT